MKTTVQKARRQRGFTLVEMSVTMAAAGLLFAAVTTGQELVDQSKATKLLNDIKSVEAQLQQYTQLKGRLPGDCNADGMIDYHAHFGSDNLSDAGNQNRADKYSYSVLMPTIPADGQPAVLETDGCALNGSGSGVADVDDDGSNANVWLNDLKVAGVVSNSAPNRRLAKAVNEDFMFVGHTYDYNGASADGARYNAIVVHNVPQWMARRLAVAINGQDARADRSRVRLMNRDGSDYNAASWQTTQSGADASATSDGMVSVEYYFDRVPESQQGG